MRMRFHFINGSIILYQKQRMSGYVRVSGHACSVRILLLYLPSSWMYSSPSPCPPPSPLLSPHFPRSPSSRSHSFANPLASSSAQLPTLSTFRWNSLPRTAYIHVQVIYFLEPQYQGARHQPYLSPNLPIFGIRQQDPNVGRSSIWGCAAE